MFRCQTIASGLMVLMSLLSGCHADRSSSDMGQEVAVLLDQSMKALDGDDYIASSRYYQQARTMAEQSGDRALLQSVYEFQYLRLQHPAISHLLSGSRSPFFSARAARESGDKERYDSLYRSITSDPGNPSYYLPMLLDRIRYLLESEPPAPDEALALFRDLFEKEGYLESFSFAKALYGSGQRDSAMHVFKRCRDAVPVRDEYARRSEAEETLAWMDLWDGNADSAVLHYKNLVRSLSMMNQRQEHSSVLMRSYEYKRNEESSDKIENQRKVLTLGFFAFVFFILAAWSLHSRQKNRYLAEIERINSIMEQLKMLLTETETEKETLRSRFVAQYKAQFVTLRKLAEETLVAEKRRDSEQYLLRKMEDLTRMILHDEQGHRVFESLLDRDLDGIMLHIRSDYPGRQEKTYWLISFLIAGFDATSISLFLDYSVESVYVRKSKIIKDFKEMESDRKELYLSYLS